MFGQSAKFVGSQRGTHMTATIAIDGKVKGATGGARIKYEARTDDGMLVLVYAPAGTARETLRVGVKFSGKKLAVEAPAKEDATDGDFSTL